MPKFILAVYLIALLSTACTFTQKVRTGMQAYEVKQYSVAVQLFEEEYNQSNSQTEKANLAFLAGESYRFLQDHGSAGNWYKLAHDHGFGDKALESYALAMTHQERYAEALRSYEQLSKQNPGSATYRSKITLTRQAMEWSRSPNTAYVVQPALFNSTFSDYSPHPIGPGQVLFTSDRDSRQSKDTYLWTGRGFSDLYVTGSFSSQVSEFDASINSQDNEGTAILSPDGRALVFTRCYVAEAYDAWCKLMISFKKGNTWTNAEPLPFVKEKVNYGHPAFAANGTTLFFSSDAAEGQGGHDIYFSQIDDTGNWSEPVNLGPLVNTAGQEQYPTVYKDTLYYSSDQLAGLGGLDIFKTYLDRNGQWAAPINLRAPVNSGADDFGFVIDTFSRSGPGVIMQGYFTTSRDGAARGDEIYSFTLLQAKPDDIAIEAPKDTLSAVPQVKYEVYISLKIVEPVYADVNDPNSGITGHRALPNGPVLMTKNKLDERFVTDQNGHVLLKLEWDKDYIFTARYRDHLASSIDVSTADVVKNPAKPITTINKTIVLDPIIKDKEIVLENILYDYDEWYIRDDAKPSLNHLASIMKSNPAIRIQLSSHTDCRGTDEYNLELSQKRAQAAVDYLISTGIKENRLLPRGYGESTPAVNCECESCSEAQHQANRRTTFKIID